MKTAMSFKIDTDVRDSARKASKIARVPLSMIVNNTLRQFAAEQQVTFRAPLIPNATTRKVLDQALRDIREGNKEAFSPAFTNMNDAIRWLNT